MEMKKQLLISFPAELIPEPILCATAGPTFHPNATPAAPIVNTSSKSSPAIPIPIPIAPIAVAPAALPTTGST